MGLARRSRRIFRCGAACSAVLPTSQADFTATTRRGPASIPMGNIPTVPGFEVQSAPTPFVKLDAGALNGGARGMQALAAGIGAVGNAIQSYTEDQAHARNVMVLADADRMLRQKRADFLESLKNDPNESNWIPKAKEVITSVKSDLSQEHPRMAPVVSRGGL